MSRPCSGVHPDYALFEVPSGCLADRFARVLALLRAIVVLVVGDDRGDRSRVEPSAPLVAVRFLFASARPARSPATGAHLRALAPVCAARATLRRVARGAAIGGAVTQPLVVAAADPHRLAPVVRRLRVLGAIWSLAFWRWFRDGPARARGRERAELQLIAAGGASNAAHAPVRGARLVRNRTLVALCAMYVGAIYGWYFYLTWLPTYLQRARRLRHSSAGWLSSLPYLGDRAGVLLAARSVTTCACALACAIGSRLPGPGGLSARGNSPRPAPRSRATASARPVALVRGRLAGAGIAPPGDLRRDRRGPLAVVRRRD